MDIRKEERRILSAVLPTVPNMDLDWTITYGWPELPDISLHNEPFDTSCNKLEIKIIAWQL